MPKSTPRRILIVAAHPDDEVLGCGGTIAKPSDAGDKVDVLIVAEGATARLETRNRVCVQNELSSLTQAAHKAGSILGAESVELLDLPDNRLDTIARLDLIKIIEIHITKNESEVVYVHHGGDVNIDHRRLHEAVVTACRPTPGHQVKRVLSYEVMSSTEWQPPGSGPFFKPNWFVEINSQLMRKKRALEAYASEMRAWPHSRSVKAIEHLARWRGAQMGVEAAEAFCLLRELR